MSPEMLPELPVTTARIACMVVAIDQLYQEAFAPESAARILHDSITRDSVGLVQAVQDPNQADVVVFAEPHSDDAERGDRVQRILRSDFFREHRDKVVVHSGKDLPRPLIPGLYPSIHSATARWLGCEGGPYLAPPNPFLESSHLWNGRIDRLASFRGACSRKPARLRLLSIADRHSWSRRGIEVIDTGADFIRTLRLGDHAGHLELKRIAVESMLASRFALCPEGAGLSSFRIYEAMQLGRAPVIIADGWCRPVGPDWNSFAIFVPRRRLAQLPEILDRHQDRWREMGACARAAWEQFFSPDTLGAWTATRAMAMVRRSATARWSSAVNGWLYDRGPRRVQLLHRRAWLAVLKKRFGRE